MLKMPCNVPYLPLFSDSGEENVQPKADKEQKKRDGKTTRVRTVLNEKQLHTLRTCYNANPRPDALMKEQMVEMTGLSPRVIRVWFQNKRCKDKKRQIYLRQMQEANKVGGQDNPQENGVSAFLLWLRMLPRSCRVDIKPKSLARWSAGHTRSGCLTVSVSGSLSPVSD